jgi:hypothetical protein
VKRSTARMRSSTPSQPMDTSRGESDDTERTHQRPLNACGAARLLNDDDDADATAWDGMSLSLRSSPANLAPRQASAGLTAAGDGLALTSLSDYGETAESWKTLGLGKPCKDVSPSWWARRD